MSFWPAIRARIDRLVDAALDRPAPACDLDDEPAHLTEGTVG